MPSASWRAKARALHTTRACDQLMTEVWRSSPQPCDIASRSALRAAPTAPGGSAPGPPSPAARPPAPSIFAVAGHRLTTRGHPPPPSRTAPTAARPGASRWAWPWRTSGARPERLAAALPLVARMVPCTGAPGALLAPRLPAAAAHIAAAAGRVRVRVPGRRTSVPPPVHHRHANLAAEHRRASSVPRVLHLASKTRRSASLLLRGLLLLPWSASRSCGSSGSPHGPGPSPERMRFCSGRTRGAHVQHGPVRSTGR